MAINQVGAYEAHRARTESEWEAVQKALDKAGRSDLFEFYEDGMAEAVIHDDCIELHIRLTLMTDDDDALAV